MKDVASSGGLPPLSRSETPASVPVYSASQASTGDETGGSLGLATVNADPSSSSPDVLTASLGTSTLTFGPYILTVKVAA